MYVCATDSFIKEYGESHWLRTTTKPIVRDGGTTDSMRHTFETHTRTHNDHHSYVEKM